MHYHHYYSIDVVNGPGTRCSLFVAGCIHQCRGCYNQTTWKIDSGLPYTLALENQIIADLQNTQIKRQGLSLSGGDPLHPANLSTILRLVQRVTQECPTKDIWLWSGYKLEQLDSAQQQLLKYIDVLVDGKFIQSLHVPNLQWRGSTNQHIHYLTSS